MKKRLFFPTISALLLIALVFGIAVLPASAATEAAGPGDLAKSSYQTELSLVWGYGGLSGLLDANNNIDPKAIATQSFCAALLRNTFGNRANTQNSWNWDQSSSATQGWYTIALSDIASGLGYQITWVGVDTSSVLTRELACKILIDMLNSRNGAMWQFVVHQNVSNSTPSSSSPGMVTINNPTGSCSFQDLVNALWRVNGSPSNYNYSNAITWAKYQGITVSDLVDPAQTPCTRAYAVWSLWKLAGSPSVASQYYKNWSDVPSDASYRTAVAWAVSKGITSGTGSQTFSPSATVTREQLATFLYRTYGAYSNYSGW